MFEFLNDILKKKERNKLKLHYSDDMIKFMSDNDILATKMLMNYEGKSNICFVDVSSKYGYVRIMPSSKYIYILDRYKIYEDMDDEWFDNMKDNFPKFYKYNNRKELIEQSIQEMRSGRFVRSVLNLKPYDVETFVIRYKQFQKKLK